MIRSDSNVREGLRLLGLDDEEIAVYLVLLRAPGTALGLSRDTGIKRTKIYQLLERLEKRSLIVRQNDERGAYFLAADPENLGIHIEEGEAELKHQQNIVFQLVPMLNALRGGVLKSTFAVRSYEGSEGFKQMFWHELKTKGELLAMGSGDIEELVPHYSWAARHRERTVDAGFRVREILNSETSLPTSITNKDYLRQYMCRGISTRVLPLGVQIVIYNDTVAISDWRHGSKVGIEIVSGAYADTMRAVFEHFWRMTEPPISRPD